MRYKISKVKSVVTNLFLGVILSLPLALASSVYADPIYLPLDQIAYTNNNQDIYLVKSDGTNNRMLVNHTNVPYAANPQISPDRSKIYYLGGSNSHVRSINVDGTDDTDLGYSSGVFSLSPDGTKIVSGGAAYSVYRSATSTWVNGMSLRIRNVDGTGSAVDVTPANDVVVGTPQSISWTPDGSKLIFQYLERNDYNSMNSCKVDIASMNTDGTGFTVLVDNTATCSGSDAPNMPAVNPVNGKIAYVVGYERSVRVMDDDGSNNTELVADNTSDFYWNVRYPSWSPNGTALAIGYRDTAVNTQGGNAVAVVDASNGTVVATSPALTNLNGYLDWASDIY